MRWLTASMLLALLTAVFFATELQRRWELPLAVPAGGFPLTVEQGDSLRSVCLLYTSPSPRDQRGSRMPSSA